MTAPGWRARAWHAVRITGPGITRGAAYSVVFLFILSFLLAAGSYALSVQAIHRSQANTAQALRNRASITQLCMSGNEARAEQIVLWDHVLTVARHPPHETPAQQQARLAALRAFEGYVHKVFAPRDCQHPEVATASQPSPW